MKTEAQKMRELLDSIQDKSNKKFLMPDQKATYDQLLDLLEFATQNGLYDAADWLKNQLNQMKIN